MAFVVEDGTIVAGANSFCSVATADTYHAKKKYSAAIWAALLTADKEFRLQEATELLEREVQEQGGWLGSPTSPSTQTLSWPRAGCPHPIKYYLQSDEIPAELQKAVAELAYQINQEELDSEPTKGLSSLGVGSIQLVFDKDNEAEPLVRSVLNFVRPFMRNKSAAFGKAVR